MALVCPRLNKICSGLYAVQGKDKPTCRNGSQGTQDVLQRKLNGHVPATPLEKMRSEPFVTDITPVAGMSQAGMSCCLPSLHMLCLIILIGRIVEQLWVWVILGLSVH